ncbi:MAG: hypothetical protein IJ638_00435 [Alphaproteobacteria bacterium]|nr:hypothetical protein [Alphaproteobacteria bacterium]
MNRIEKEIKSEIKEIKKEKFEKYLMERKDIKARMSECYVIINSSTVRILTMADSNSPYNSEKLVDLEAKKSRAFEELNRLKKMLKSKPSPLIYFMKLLREK